MVAEPRPAPGEKAFDTERTPLAHDLLDVVDRERRLRAERVTAQVDEFAPHGVLRQHEALAPALQRIGGVECVCVFAIEPHGARSRIG